MGKHHHRLSQHRSAPPDRRQHNRFIGHGLVANVAGRLAEILDVSLTGVRLAGELPHHGGPLPLTIIPRHHKALALNSSIQTFARVVRTVDGDTHLRFERVTYSLVKLIVQHTSERLGVAPYLVK